MRRAKTSADILREAVKERERWVEFEQRDGMHGFYLALSAGFVLGFLTCLILFLTNLLH